MRKLGLLIAILAMTGFATTSFALDLGNRVTKGKAPCDIGSNVVAASESGTLSAGEMADKMRSTIKRDGKSQATEHTIEQDKKK